MPGSSRIHAPNPSRFPSPSPESRSTSQSSHRSTPVTSNSSNSYRRRKALFGFGEPRARPRPEPSVPEDRQPHESTESVRHVSSNSSRASITRSNLSTSESRRQGIPNHLPQNRDHKRSSSARGMDEYSTRTGSSNNSVAGSGDKNARSPLKAAREQPLPTDDISSLYSNRESHRRSQRVQIQVNAYGNIATTSNFDPGTQNEPSIEHVHSLRSALSEDTIVSDITRSTTHHSMNVAGGGHQKTSKDPPDNVDLSQQKVVSSPEQAEQGTNQNSSWWLQMFQRLEEKHEKERTAWQEQLHSAKEKKQEYKEELRQNLSSQLQWLEEHLTAPNHILPGIGNQETSSTDSMSQEDSKRSAKSTYDLQYHIDGPSDSGLSSVKGIEVTLDSANHIQRLQQLENILQETNRQHEQDRLEWVRTLEEAASVTQAGEELSSQQQQQLKQLQKEVDRVNKKQKAQMNEKTAVLTELLELTEKQHAAEKQAWQQELEQMNVSLAHLQEEKNELVQNSEQLQNEIDVMKLRATEEIHSVEDLKQSIEDTKKKTAEELRKAIEENEQLRKELHELQSDMQRVAHDQQTTVMESQDLKNQISRAMNEKAELQEEKEAMTHEIDKLHRDLNAARQETDYFEQNTNMKSQWRRWLEDLDRATAERDIFRQEAESLRREVDGLKQANQNRSIAAGVTSVPPYLPQQTLRVISTSTSSATSLPSTLQHDSGEETEIISKYRDAVEKHSELVNRLKVVEDQRSSERDRFKLQLEEAIAGSHEREEEKKALERHIEELTESHGKEVFDLTAKLRNLEAVIDQRSEVFEISESNSNDLKEEVQRLNKKLKQVEEEMEYRCDQLVEKNYLEVSELKEKLNDIQRERTRAMNEVRKLHEAQRGPRGEDLPSQLKATEEENRSLNLHVNELTKSLNEYKSLHSKAVKRFDHALTEKNRLHDELDAIRSGRNVHLPQSEIVNRLDSNQATMVNIVEELRTDISSFHNVLKGSAGKNIEEAQISALRADMINIQNTLNDAVAELTLEADALIQSRDAIQNAALSVTQSAKEKSSYLELQERMMVEQQKQLIDEFNVLREHVNRAMENQQQQASTNNDDTAVLTRELITDLQSKEAALATAQTELQFCKEKLEAEITARMSAEKDLNSVNEQTDALEEEIMTLRSANTKLIKKLRTAGMRIDAALLAGRMSACNDDTSTVATPRSNTTIKRDDSFTVLDEALALATGLSDIVGEGQKGKKSTMEMLESMHGLIDVCESSSPVTSPSSSISPRLRNRKIFDTESGAIEIIHEVIGAESADDTEPSTCVNQANRGPPVLKLPIKMSKTSELQLVVEQLYGRCETLERERIEMMEVTLDLLESARSASSNELAAALATARQRATEEVQRIHEQNYQDQERIFHRLCSQHMFKGKHFRNRFRAFNSEDQENNCPKLESAGNTSPRISV